MPLPIRYFNKTGKRNTIETLRLAKEYADEMGLRDIIVASTGGSTGLEASKIFGEPYNLIVVSHPAGYKREGIQELSEKAAVGIRHNGGKILTSVLALSGVERAMRNHLKTWGPVEIVAQAYRCFGQGTKVCVEITLMAADSGLIDMKKNVIAIGGTGYGADTAWVIKPAHSIRFFDLRISQLICKPIFEKSVKRVIP